MLRIICAGEFFGELALITPGPRNATIAALDPVETLCIHTNDFEELRDRHPAVERVLTHALVAEVRRLSIALSESLYLSADKRVLRRLLEAAALFGTDDGARDRRPAHSGGPGPARRRRPTHGEPHPARGRGQRLPARCAAAGSRSSMPPRSRTRRGDGPRTTGRPTSGEVDGERLEAAQHERVAIARSRSSPQPGSITGNRSRSWSSTTRPSARANGAPRQKWIPAPKLMSCELGTADVEAVGIVEHARVAVRGAEQGDDLLAGLHRTRRAARGPRTPCARRAGPGCPSGAAPPLRCRPSVRSSRSRRSSSGMVEQREQPVADEVGGGLESGREEEDDRRDQLVVVQLVALLLDVDQLREQIVGRLRTPIGDQPFELLGDRARGRPPTPRPARARERSRASRPRCAPTAGARASTTRERRASRR